MLLDEVGKYLAAFGYYFLFLATAFENVPFVGLFLPGEVIVVAAAFFAARGELDISAVFGVAVLGGIVGNNVGYWLGRYGGRPFIERLAERFRFDRKHVVAAEEYFDGHGAKTVFIARYIAGLKAFVTALAGASHMNYAVFLSYSSAGIISWTFIAVVLGYFFGQYFNTVISILKTSGWVIPLIIILLLIVVWLRRRRKIRDG